MELDRLIVLSGLLARSPAFRMKWKNLWSGLSGKSISILPHSRSRRMAIEFRREDEATTIIGPNTGERATHSLAGEGTRRSVLTMNLRVYQPRYQVIAVVTSKDTVTQPARTGCWQCQSE